jgi:DNA replication protein DnaC
MKETIANYCKTLKLGRSIVHHYSEIEASTHEEFLEKLLKNEVERRERERVNRLIREAGFDVVKTFAGYSFDRIEMPQGLATDDLITSSFVDKKENLICFGPVGTGKTHCATAVGVEACQRGKRVRYYRTAHLVNELVDAKARGTLTLFLRKLERLDLLICDEWGYIPLDREGVKLLFQVVSDCYEKRSVIITTNLEFSKWNGIFYDEVITSAIIDRLIHHCHLLVFTGKSYRLEHSSLNH